MSQDLLTLEVQIPLIKRSDRFIVANGEVYFLGVQGSIESRTIKYNLFSVDEWGNHLFDGGYDSLEKLSTATYAFLGKFEIPTLEEVAEMLDI